MTLKCPNYDSFMTTLPSFAGAGLPDGTAPAAKRIKRTRLQAATVPFLR